LANKPGTKKWNLISKKFSEASKSPRTGKQCRDRWLNYLSPRVRTGCRKKGDANKLFYLQRKLGNAWTLIAAKMPGWGANSVKNAFYSTIRRNLQRFNKWKKPEECIRGHIEKIMENTEIRDILTAGKNISAIDFSRKKLSKSALRFIRETEAADERENVSANEASLRENDDEPWELIFTGYYEGLVYSDEGLSRILDNFYRS
jgi:hypothetical protein